MRRWWSIISILTIGLAGEFIPQDRLNTLADNLIRERFGPGFILQDVLTYYGEDNLPNAFSFVYNNNEKVINIVLGARYTCSPVFEISQKLPNYYPNLNKAKGKTEEKLNRILEFDRIYYFGPLEEYFCFRNGKEEILVNTYSLRTFEKKEFFEKFKRVEDYKLEEVLKNKWDKYLAQTEFFRDTVMNYVDSVPFIDWVYGCSPTAASMILWYWDPRGYGRLVDYFFTHWDNPEGEWNDCANVNRELAIAMHTDTMTGATYITNIPSGIIYVCNTINGYSFNSQLSPQGTPNNQFMFSWIKNEIDNQRPCHWNVLQYQGDPYFNHSVTGVGYAYGSSLPDTFVIVHDTWTISEPWWPLWTYANGYQSYDYVVTVIPGGANPNNILLRSPQNCLMFKGLKYYLYWDSFGSDISKVQIYYSIGRDGMSYDSLYWFPIDLNAPNTEKYIWTVPDQDSSFRINLIGLNSVNIRLGADGSFHPIIPCSIEQSPGVHLTSHFDTDGSSGDIVKIGNLLYVADYTNGILMLDASDSSILDFAGKIENIGAIKGFYYSAPYLYAVDYTGDTLRIFDLTNPQSPVQIGRAGVLNDPSFVFVQGNYAYLACGANGMAVVNCSIPNAPYQVGVFDSPGQAYSVYVVDTIAYLADGTKGLRILNVKDPTNPVEINSYDPNLGVTQGIEKNGDYLYLADGSIGVRILHLTSPVTVESISVYNTPGVARYVKYLNNHLFVADGTQGVRIINIASVQNPSEVGYLLSKSNATRLSVAGNKIYLADDADGVYLITHEFIGINEVHKANPGAQFMVKCPTIVNISQGLKINLSLKSSSNLSVKVYSADGKFVDLLYQGSMRQGANEIFYRPNASSGVYFLLTTDGNTRVIKKILFVK